MRALWALCCLTVLQAAQCSNVTKRACYPATVNDATIELITSREGFRDSPYDTDGAHKWTVGYGHLCDQKQKCQELGLKFPITETQAAALFRTDLNGEKGKLVQLNNMLENTVVLNDNQYGALVDLMFNVKVIPLANSNLIGRLNAGEDPAVVLPQELPKFNKAGKPLKVLRGLVKRRAAAVVLAQTPSNNKIYPCDKDSDGDPGDPDEPNEK